MRPARNGRTGLGSFLAPALDINAAIRRQAATLMQQRLLKSLSPGTVMGTVLEAKELAAHLPRRGSKRWRQAS